MNEEEGYPYTLVLSDLFDLEGREYHKRATDAAEWTQPVLNSTLNMKDSGANDDETSGADAWRSYATVELAAMERFPDDERFRLPVGFVEENIEW